jgi:hypothetical protein
VVVGALVSPTLVGLREGTGVGANEVGAPAHARVSTQPVRNLEASFSALISLPLVSV